MKFTEELFLKTKDAHKDVDRHTFVELIKTHKNAGELYINFNKICISIIQDTIKKNHQCIPPELFNKLYREKVQIDFFITNNLKSLLEKCQKYPLEHAYMFYLGLAFGGNLLSKMLPKHILFLKYDNSKELIKEFKMFLDEKIVDDKSQTDFINVVNDSYKIIKNIFDDFYKLISHTITIT